MRLFFGVGGVFFIIGVVVTVGGWIALMGVCIRYGLITSSTFTEGLRRLYSEEGRVDRRKALVRIVIMVAGIAILFSSIGIGDWLFHAPCRDECRAAGYSSGLFRYSPHWSVARGSRGCWCTNGPEDWARTALDMPVPD